MADGSLGGGGEGPGEEMHVEQGRTVPDVGEAIEKNAGDVMRIMSPKSMHSFVRRLLYDDATRSMHGDVRRLTYGDATRPVHDDVAGPMYDDENRPIRGEVGRH